MTTEKKASCCCSKNGKKKASCEPYTITLLMCPACGLMYNKTFKDCPQCSAEPDKKPVKKKKKDR